MQSANFPLVFPQSAPGYTLGWSFHGKVLSLSLFFFFPSLLLSNSFGCCLLLAPSDCPQDI